MKLLIDIPEHIYEHAKETTEDSRDEFDAMRAIANGTQPESRSENPNTCEDAISRQAVIDILDDMVKNYVNENDFDKAQGIAWVKVQRLPSVTPQQGTGRWIPVSERLPEDQKKCLVAFKGGYVGIMCYASDLYRVDEYDFCDEKGMAGWYDYDRELGYYSRDDVIAWRSLPEPYKAESEAES